MKRSSGDTADRKPKTKRPTWLGGFIRMTASGKPTYVIERHWRGGYFKASTRCHTEKAALTELARFEEDPEGYVAGGRDRLLMTPELVMEYRNHLLDRGNTYDWARDCARVLSDWMEAIDGRDLRRLDAARDIRPALVRWRGARSRIVAMKGFMSWLRKDKGLMKHHEDPMPDVRIPKGQSRRLTAPRDVPLERVMLVYRHLREDVRDVLQLLAATGWHLSEAIRFAHNGEIRRDPTGKALATLVTWHKSKENSVSGITTLEHLEAARRIRAKGTMLGRSRLAFLIRRANVEAGVSSNERQVYFGDMRHNVGTWALEAGESIENTAKHANHTDERMMREHYVRHAVPRAVIKTHVLK